MTKIRSIMTHHANPAKFDPILMISCQNLKIKQIQFLSYLSEICSFYLMAQSLHNTITFAACKKIKLTILL
jgi:hypothetical protein